MESKLSKSSKVLTIRFYLSDGSVQTFGQPDQILADQIWDSIDPARLFATGRLVIASEHSKTVFASSEILRIDLLKENCECWEFTGGYSDIVELSETEFRKNARLDQPELMTRRDQPTPVGDLLVSFRRLNLRGGQPLYLMVELPVKLPAENQSFMRFFLSKGSFHMRLSQGGIGVVNLSNLVAYTVYPGVAQVPGDSWLAEPS